MKTFQASSPSTILESDVFSEKSPTTEADSSQASSDNLSMDLCLCDSTWPFPQKNHGSTAPLEARTIDLSFLKVLSKRDMEREREIGVSTELSLVMDPWTIKKHLTKSDIENLSRLLLLTRSVTTHILPHLRADQVASLGRGGDIDVDVTDVDTGLTHRLILKRWITKSYVLIGNWRKEFVNRRNLKAGDEIGLFWDSHSSKMYFSLLSRAQAPKKA